MMGKKEEDGRLGLKDRRWGGGSGKEREGEGEVG